jgi:integrase
MRDRRRDRALILLGYASAMRPSELSALRIDDLDTRPEGVVITIRRSKTDQDGVGQIVGVVAGRRCLTDPVAALAAWLSIRPTGPGPAFTRVHPSGKATLEPIGVRTVSRMVQDRAIAAGLGKLRVTGHSLRAGHATAAAAAENGADVTRIAAQTRHRDIGTLIEHCIRPSDAIAASTSRDLGL